MLLITLWFLSSLVLLAEYLGLLLERMLEVKKKKKVHLGIHVLVSDLEAAPLRANNFITRLSLK